MDAEDIHCAGCGGGEANDDDDILLCDGFCDRAFHQSCVQPPVAVEDIPEGDEGWLCPLCDARVDAFYTINNDFDLELDAAKASWVDVFADEAAANDAGEGPGQPNDPAAKPSRGAGGVMDEEWADDESDDEDFGEDGASDDGEDDEDEPLSGSARSSDSDESDTADSDENSEAARLRRAMREEPEVMLGKRRRVAVDYRKLNDEMFGDGEAFEGEREDERIGGWGPASPKTKSRGSGGTRASHPGASRDRDRCETTRGDEPGASRARGQDPRDVLARPRGRRFGPRGRRRRRRRRRARDFPRDARRVGARVRREASSRAGRVGRHRRFTRAHSAPGEGLVSEPTTTGQGERRFRRAFVSGAPTSRAAPRSFPSRTTTTPRRRLLRRRLLRVTCKMHASSIQVTRAVRIDRASVPVR